MLHLVFGAFKGFRDGFKSDSQFPLVDRHRGVSVGPAGQLNILTVQVPVSIKPFNLHLGFICKEGTVMSAQPLQNMIIKLIDTVATLLNHNKTSEANSFTPHLFMVPTK